MSHTRPRLRRTTQYLTGQVALSRRLPEYPGFEHFRGESLHSSEYRHSGPFHGKRVLVVGCGAASGSDISLDLSWGAKQVVIMP